MGKTLILLGILLIVIGTFFTLGGKIPWLGRLPGDIVVHKKNFTLYFPVTTCILLSIILSVILFLLFKHKAADILCLVGAAPVYRAMPQHIGSGEQGWSLFPVF